MTVHTSGDVVCVEGTDFTADLVTGIITVVADGLLDAAADAKVAYVRADPSVVVSADVVGATDVDGNRSGAQSFLGAATQFGFGPKILIAPTFSSVRTVADALVALSCSPSSG